MNADLKKLQSTLSARVLLLSKRLGRTSDPAVAQAIVREIQEFNHRVTIVGQLLFSRETKKLATLVKRIDERKAAVDKAISKIDDLKNALDTIASFLALVDEAIDLAKAIGA